MLRTLEFQQAGHELRTASEQQPQPEHGTQTNPAKVVKLKNQSGHTKSTETYDGGIAQFCFAHIRLLLDLGE
jgi:hypothetical protein